MQVMDIKKGEVDIQGNALMGLHMLVLNQHDGNVIMKRFEYSSTLNNMATISKIADTSILTILAKFKNMIWNIFLNAYTYQAQ